MDYIFDIADTYSLEKNLFSDDYEQQSILDDLAAPYKVKDHVNPAYVDNVIDALPLYGVAADFSFVAGAELGAQIEWLDNKSKTCDVPIEYLPDGKVRIARQKAKYLISINNKADKDESFASLCHELAHLFCYHLSPPQGWNFPPRVISHNAQEFEAESTVWLICERLGVVNPSEKYLAGYLAKNSEIPIGVSVERIFSAFNEIWKMMQINKKMNVKEGFFYKYDKDFKQLVDTINKEKKLL